MKKILLSIVLIFTISIVSGCAKSPPTEQQVFEMIKNKSTIADYNFFELKEVSIKSSAWDDVRFKPLLRITFLYTGDSEVWSRKDKYDFIPSGTILKKGMNSIDATAFFERSYAGDGSWGLVNFSL